MFTKIFYCESLDNIENKILHEEICQVALPSCLCHFKAEIKECWTLSVLWWMTLSKQGVICCTSLIPSVVKFDIVQHPFCCKNPPRIATCIYIRIRKRKSHKYAPEILQRTRKWFKIGILKKAWLSMPPSLVLKIYVVNFLRCFKILWHVEGNCISRKQ